MTIRNSKQAPRFDRGLAGKRAVVARGAGTINAGVSLP